MESLCYEIAVLLDELEDFVVVLGGGVVDATALDYFEGREVEFDGLYPFVIDGCREDEGIGLKVVLAGK